MSEIILLDNLQIFQANIINLAFIHLRIVQFVWLFLNQTAIKKIKKNRNFNGFNT